MQLNIEEALSFLDMLEHNGRHTIASEAPFGRSDGSPLWESGATYEDYQRDMMITDIKQRQNRKSNVYYSVNKPCPISDRQGAGGKNNIDDIISVRALAFDIDFISFQRDHDAVLAFLEQNLELKPSLIINTGGGFHLIYLLDERLVVNLRYLKQTTTEKDKKIRDNIIANRACVTSLGHDFEHLLRARLESLPIKVDNMSNIDRVMRLPGTVNYPKAEKVAKGQVVALSYIAKNYFQKYNINMLRSKVPAINMPRQSTSKQSFVPRKDSIWTAYKKALACVEFIRDEGLADTNEWYTLHVMLPLIGAIHDDNLANQLTIDEATELFLEAVSGGERYGTMGRGQGYFMRQWKSHRPELPRTGTKSLGGLIWAAKEAGFKLPWVDEIMWESDYKRMIKENEEQRLVVPQEIKDLFG